MLKDNVFGKKTGIAGILLAVVGLGLYVPVVGLILSLVSLIPGTAWYLLVAKSLYKTSKLDTNGGIH
jgi:hypothetical protein